MRPVSVKYEAVLFDLFSALLESGTLWSDVAGTAELGSKWRDEASHVAYLSLIHI